VVVFYEMAEFVDDDVVDVGFRGLDESQVEVDAGSSGATAPAFLHEPDFYFGIWGVVALDSWVVYCQSFGEYSAGLAAVPIN